MKQYLLIATPSLQVYSNLHGPVVTAVGSRRFARKGYEDRLF